MVWFGSPFVSAARNTSDARSLLVVLAVVGCLAAQQVPNAEGTWFGGGANQLSVSLSQHGQHLSASGWIARAGRSDGYRLPVTGSGKIDSDSTIVLDLHGYAGNQRFEGKLLRNGTLSGAIAGDRFERAVTIDLARQ